VHQYPLAGAREVPVGTDIGIRAIGAYDPAHLATQTFIAVGSRSGVHPMAVHLSHDRTVAIFHSATAFAYGESVHFEMSTRIAGGMAITDTFTFQTMVKPAPATIPDLVRNEVPIAETRSGTFHVASIEQDSLPPMTVTVDDSATPGTIYFDNFGFTTVPNACFLFNCNEHGQIIRDEEQPGESSRDFKLQPTGLRTYFDVNTGAFLGVDSNWNIVDTFAALHYGTDQHELRMFPDGSYALLGLSISYIDMSKLVPGGIDSAEVYGDVIQKFDPDGNLVFEWRGIDHYDVADSKYEDLTGSGIDFEHANSLDFDSTGNIVLSNRHLCEISNIDGVTGDFIWRLGGAHNQFTLVGDSIWFSFQHAARWIPNGHLTAFDNSNYDTITGGNGTWIQQSRAVEYALDTAAKTATLVWQYHHAPETWSAAMGYVERLPNGNTFIGWGDDTSVAMTEVRQDKSTAFEMVMGAGNVSYRAIKFLPDTIRSILDTSARVLTAPDAGYSGNNLEIEAGTDGTISANISLDLSQFVTLTVYDMTGRAIRNVLTSSWESSGSHPIALDLQGLSDGSYECVLTTEYSTLIRSFTHLQ
jgi:hypothetical protein